MTPVKKSSPTEEIKMLDERDEPHNMATVRAVAALREVTARRAEPSPKILTMTFRCTQCRGVVRAKTGPGRTEEYRRGIYLPLPDDFPIPTCEDCGETYMSPDLSDRIEELFATPGAVDRLQKIQ